VITLNLLTRLAGRNMSYDLIPGFDVDVKHGSCNESMDYWRGTVAAAVAALAGFRP
jgi:hypothetical protein